MSLKRENMRLLNIHNYSSATMFKAPCVFIALSEKNTITADFRTIIKRNLKLKGKHRLRHYVVNRILKNRRFNSRIWQITTSI